MWVHYWNHVIGHLSFLRIVVKQPTDKIPKAKIKPPDFQKELTVNTSYK